MNSILQCLSNTRELRDYCLQRLYMRDLGHTSSAHTALMEGEEHVGVAPLPFSALPFHRAGLMLCCGYTPNPLVFFLCLFLVGAQVSKSVVETQPSCVTLVGAMRGILLLRPPGCWDQHHHV